VRRKMNAGSSLSLTAVGCCLAAGSFILTAVSCSPGPLRHSYKKNAVLKDYLSKVSKGTEVGIRGAFLRCG
jgi:hypothetical protein